MAIQDADVGPTTVRSRRDPTSVKNMSELGKLLSSMDTQHVTTHASLETLDSVRAPDMEIRDPDLEPIPSPQPAPVNLVPSRHPQPVNTSHSQGNTMNANTNPTTIAMSPVASAADALNTTSTVLNIDKALAATGVSPVAGIIGDELKNNTTTSQQHGIADTAPGNANAPAAAAAAGMATIAEAPKLGKIGRKVAVGIEDLVIRSTNETEQVLAGKFNGLVNGTVEIRDELSAVSDRLATLEARRASLTIGVQETDWKTEVPKQIAIGTGVAVLTYASIVLVGKAIQYMTADDVPAEQ